MDRSRIYQVSDACPDVDEEFITWRSTNDNWSAPILIRILRYKDARWTELDGTPVGEPPDSWAFRNLYDSPKEEQRN